MGVSSDRCINTRPLVGCLESADRKVKQFRVIPRIASSRLVYSSSIQCPITECVWFCNVTPDLYRENCHATDIALTERLGLNGFYVIFSDKFGLYSSCKANQTDLNAVYYFSDPTNVGCFFAISFPPSTDSAKINTISTNGKQDATRRLEATQGKHGFLCYIFRL